MRRVGLIWVLLAAGCVGELDGSRIGTGAPAIDPDDVTPPRLTILSPPPDSIVEGTTVTITGRAEDDEGPVTVTLDGDRVTVGPDGTWTWTGTLDPGAHRFRFVARDGGGHEVTAWTALLAGDFASAGTPVEQALAVHASRAALAEVGRGAGAILAAQDFDPMLQALNPVYEDFWGEVEIRGEDHGAIHVTLEPLDGALRAVVRMESVSVRFFVDLEIVGGVGGSISFGAITLDLTLGLGAADGMLQATPGATSIAIEDFRFDISGVPGVIENIDVVRDAVRDKVQEGLESGVSGALPGAITDAVASLPSEHQLDLLGAPVTLATPWHSLLLTPDGLDAAVNLSARAVMPMVGRGSVRYLRVGSHGGPPLGGSDLGVAVSVDALNALLAESWAGGALRRRIDAVPFSDSASLQVRQLAILAPGIGRGLPPESPVAVEIDAALPPVATIEGGGVRMACADARVRLLAADAGGMEQELLSLSIAFGATLVPRAGVAELVLDVADIEISGDAVGPSPSGFPRGERLDALLEELLASRVSGLLGTDGIRLPSLYGFVIDAPTLTAADGYLALQGSIRYSP